MLADILRENSQLTYLKLKYVSGIRQADAVYLRTQVPLCFSRIEEFRQIQCL